MIDHIISAIDGARICSEPFSHFYVENVFPDDVYEQLLSGIPDAATYHPIDLDRWHRADGTSTRDTIILDDHSLVGMAAAWRQVRDVLVGDLRCRTFATLFRKLEAGIRDRFGRSIDADKLADISSADLQLMRDTEDYEILPHTDSQSKLVTMQFYLPRDNNNEDLGTSIYDGDGAEVRRFPFRRNSAYAFVISDHSWHGRKKLAQFDGVRNTLIFSPRTKRLFVENLR